MNNSFNFLNNVLIEHTDYRGIIKARDDMHIWLADQHEVPLPGTPLFPLIVRTGISFNEARKKEKTFCQPIRVLKKTKFLS